MHDIERIARFVSGFLSPDRVGVCVDVWETMRRESRGPGVCEFPVAYMRRKRGAGS